MNSKVPITIGITGHRKFDLSREAEIRAELKNTLVQLSSSCPNSSLYMLNSLAEGCDALAADVAIELGMPIIAVLPFDVQRYEKDFSGEVLNHFRELLGKCDKQIIVPAEGSDDDHYKAAGLYVANHSHVMIALWDGKEGNHNGCGSADIVYYIKHKQINYAIEHIMTPRENSDVEIKTNLLESDPGHLERLLKAEEELNLEVKCQDLYESCDKLSIENQKKYLSHLKTLAFIGVALVVSFLFYDEMDVRICLPIYAVLLACGMLILRRGQKLKYHEKYFNYRMMAESLRVQKVLDAQGIDANAADNYTWTQADDTAWIKKAIDAISIFSTKKAINDKKSLWITEQLEYHKKALLKAEKAYKKTQRISTILSVLTVLVTLLALFIEYCFRPIMLLEFARVEIKTYFLVAVGLISAIALFVSSYYGKLNIKRKAEDHKAMIKLYSKANDLLEIGGLTDEFVLKIAKEEIIENGNWYSYTKEESLGIEI